MQHYEEIYKRYEAEVLALFPELESWWESIDGTTNGDSERDQRWPMGFPAHPRFIALFRGYCAEIVKRTEELEASTEESELVREPQALLREKLVADNPHLFEPMSGFIYIPFEGGARPGGSSDDSLEPIDGKYFFHRVERSLPRLRFGPRDLSSGIELPAQSKSRDGAHPKIAQAYEAYLAAAREVCLSSEAWWKRVVDSVVEKVGDWEHGLDQAADAHPAAASANPDYIAFIREQWETVSRLNAELEVGERVAPQEFLFGWPYDDGREDVYRAISAMPYWPIGLDAHGHWC